MHLTIEIQVYCNFVHLLINMCIYILHRHDFSKLKIANHESQYIYISEDQN